eukprot:CAMPEP_0198521714 /NCGR_PEP_ID=MMETSP1462-20131121/21100_1 /TAXON_ID=1333877 /ORGANISM="Brandtodinium nutriculum, Strain RCC3387" /LENGTH=212 /DNA_ID=CAMNT_0044251365 /DNA_START=312 /DNA_END=946 /DNA_ORIENTATION=+
MDPRALGGRIHPAPDVRLLLKGDAAAAVHDQQCDLRLVARHADLHRLRQAAASLGRVQLANRSEAVLQQLDHDVEQVLRDERQRPSVLGPVEGYPHPGHHREVRAGHLPDRLNRPGANHTRVALSIHDALGRREERQILRCQRLHADSRKEESVHEAINESPRVPLWLSGSTPQLHPFLHPERHAQRVVSVPFFELLNHQSELVWAQGLRLP